MIMGVRRGGQGGPWPPPPAPLADQNSMFFNFLWKIVSLN